MIWPLSAQDNLAVIKNFLQEMKLEKTPPPYAESLPETRPVHFSLFSISNTEYATRMQGQEAMAAAVIEPLPYENNIKGFTVLQSHRYRENTTNTTVKVKETLTKGQRRLKKITTSHHKRNKKQSKFQTQAKTKMHFITVSDLHPKHHSPCVSHATTVLFDKKYNIAAHRPTTLIHIKSLTHRKNA